MWTKLAKHRGVTQLPSFWHRNILHVIQYFFSAINLHSILQREVLIRGSASPSGALNNNICPRPTHNKKQIGGPLEQLGALSDCLVYLCLAPGLFLILQLERHVHQGLRAWSSFYRTRAINDAYFLPSGACNLN